MINLPTGTVTFLFTDIEDSTKLAQQSPDALPALLLRHREILNQAFAANHGFIFQVVGDSFSVAFHTATDALYAALQAQQSLHSEPWMTSPIKVRMGIHTGAAQLANDPTIEGPYSGYTTLALTQRIMSAAHGGQILLSQTVYELTRDEMTEEHQFIDMGEHRLKSMLRPEHLYQLNAPGLPSTFPPLKTLESSAHNLPLQLTSFIGREKEIAEIKNLLHSARLVTLTGSGGTGKTRLSQEIGAQELIDFPHGVWIVELAPLTEPVQVIPALAQVFGLQELPFNPLKNLVTDYLRDKKILLIFDNCEHLIEACARLVDELLHQCAGLKILSSSREALGIAGEVSYHVPSLADSESTQLFVDRARAANSNFRLTETNASSIAQICSRLDGIPLAIELGAARVKLLSPEQIAARLDDRFRLLVGGSRTALPRQQTLRALIDWSYDLLSEEEKRLLQFAAVFVGGWTLDALEAVADDLNTIEHLEQLVNKSLVVTEERETEMRYFMLETIRQYAREKLFEAKQSSLARDRHFVYFNQLSEIWWDTFRSSNILPILSRIDEEIENVRAALEWGSEHHAEENVRLAANFCVTSAMLSMPAEGVGILMAATERARSLPPAAGGDADLYRKKLFARALFVQGMVGLGVGNIPIVVAALQEAIAISRAIGDKQMLGSSLSTYYTASTFIDLPGAEEAAQEALKIFTEDVNDSFGLGMAQLNMARLYAHRGNETEKERYIGQLRALVSEMPNSFQVSMFLLGLGMDERMRGNYDSARKIFEQGREAFSQIHSKYFVMVMSSEQGHVERQKGNVTQARLIYRETIKGWQDLGNRAAIAHQLECFGFLAVAEEEPQAAVKLFGAAEALRDKIQAPMTDYERVEYDQAGAHVRSLLPEPEFSSLWVEGQSMTMEQAIEFALSL
ncbi:MAG TPA: adenylate/guanylate cyclase domain-containing protein [Anaerolineales bacterium]|nr:adenylate/guanylate cyclase domain-containing protein [Anaerolineales bacterium]